MHRLSFRHKYAFKLSTRDHDALVRAMKEKVKRDPAVKEKFEEYGVPLDEIDEVHVEFADLPVSAKTKNMKIYLNIAMLKADSEVDDPSNYLAHELVHYLQQKTGNTDGHNAVDEYLEKPTEQEAFRVQIEYKERNESPKDAKDYLEGLLDHHDVHDKEDRKELRDKLTEEDD